MPIDWANVQLAVARDAEEKRKVAKPAIVVKPLDIDNLLYNPRNRVARVGVELEGGWNVIPPGIALEHDGSVFRGNRELLAKYPAQHKSGELPIGPVVPAGIPTLMKRYYPHVVDATCGMHVHMSFETLKYYAWLMEPEYQETICEYLTRWAKKEGFPADHFIFDRLAGRSMFCQKQFWPDAQATRKDKDHDQQRPGHRYTVIHYCGRQNTIEVRVLPMMDEVAQAIRGVKEVIDITNACLVALAGREETVVGKLQIPNGEVFEEFIDEEVPLTAYERRRLR